MVPFLLPNLRKLLNWYFFVPKFSHFSQMVPILVSDFCTLLKWYHILVFKIFHTVVCTRMVPFLLLNFGTLKNGTIFVCDFLYFSLMVPFFVAEFSHIPQLVPYLLQNCRTFLKWYHFCFIFSHFAQIGSTIFGTFWRQKVKRGLNFWGV